MAVASKMMIDPAIHQRRVNFRGVPHSVELVQWFRSPTELRYTNNLVGTKHRAVHPAHFEGSYPM